MSRRRLLFWALCLLSVVFAVRAVYGLIAGLSYAEGRRLAGRGQYERALPLLERAAVGELLPDAHWFAGEVRLGLWQQEIDAGSDPQDVAEILAAAYVDVTAALAASPASGWHWMALGNLYHQAERLSAHLHGVPLSLLGEDPWARVGRPGRIGIGMMRIGLTREPNWYLFRDQLAYVYYDYLLLEETYDAVYGSALALPVYELHPYRTLRPADPDILDAFARGALDSLGRVPWMRPVRHRVALGRLEVRRENWTAAETHLRQALGLDGIELNVAEAQYYLGLSLEGQGRLDEAREALIEAEKQPPLALLSVIAQAGLAERLEQHSEALNLWSRANRLDPHRLDVSLRLADAALAQGEPQRAIHTLREAVRMHPTATEPLVKLVDSYIGQKDLRKARIGLKDLERLSPEHPALRAFREKLRAR